jgi:hypothetical protein
MALSVYGRVIRGLRGLTNSTVNKEPKWRKPGRELTTGYHGAAYANGRSGKPVRPSEPRPSGSGKP